MSREIFKNWKCIQKQLVNRENEPYFEEGYFELSSGSGCRPGGFSMTGYLEPEVVALLNAAPDLLDALEEMIKQFDDNFPEGGHSWSAIDKAKYTIKKSKGLLS